MHALRSHIPLFPPPDMLDDEYCVLGDRRLKDRVLEEWKRIRLGDERDAEERC